MLVMLAMMFVEPMFVCLGSEAPVYSRVQAFEGFGYRILREP